MTINTIIPEAKARLSSRLAVLGHHYQSDAVVAHCDHLGDSLELARKIDTLAAEHVVFCGVFFMAESAAILARSEQKIHIPDTSASCAMADMAEADNVRKVLERLTADGRTITPLTYVNSSADVKAVVGAAGGTVCTSANAPTMLRWAFAQGDGVLFLPDMHLARNTGKSLGVPESKQLVLDLERPDPAREQGADLLIWPGYCPVHDIIPATDVAAIRASEPEARIVVHPECPPAVVDACDAAGSTSYLIKYCAEAPKGSTIYVGTEQNLVARLAKRHAGEKTIKPLRVSFCDDMAKITTDNLAALLSHLDEATPVTVDETIAGPARVALERMLEASK